MKARLAEMGSGASALEPPQTPDQGDSETSLQELKTNAHQECIDALRRDVGSFPHSILCPVCGRETIERRKSALELWEEFLAAGPGEEKEWLSRTEGRLLQFANYILIMLAAVALLALGMYVVYFEFWALVHTAVWWLSALGILVLVRLFQGLRERTTK